MDATGGSDVGEDRGTRRLRARGKICSLILLLGLSAGAAAADGGVGVGLGSYATKPPSGMLGGGVQPPAAEYRVGEAAAHAAPTNQWFSSVIFNQWSAALHAHPMTYRAAQEGFEVGMPDRQLVTEKIGPRAIRYAHAPAITISPAAFKPVDARLADYSDWLVKIRMAAGGTDALTATILHGSPFSYYECSTGDVRFHLSGAPVVLSDPRAAGREARLASFSIAGHAYAVFAPKGSSWEWSQPAELVLHLPADRRYFSVAGLPDEHEATLKDFLEVAYAFPAATHAQWAYDPASSVVRTTYTVDTVAMEGEQRTTLMGLYPHQWDALKSPPPSKYRYESVRGPIRLVAGNSFTVERTYHGILPEWPGLEDPAHRAAVDSLLVGDLAKAGQMYSKNYGSGTYWVGIGLGAAAQLMGVAEAEGRTAMRDKMLGDIESRLESWFDGKHSTHFMQDSRIGTFVGYPQEFDSITHMNDHHFHYGYWLNGAAQVTLRDPQWGVGGQMGRHGGQTRRRHRHRRARKGRFSVSSQLRYLRGSFVGFRRCRIGRRQQSGILLRSGQCMGGTDSLGRSHRQCPHPRSRYLPLYERGRLGADLLVRPQARGAFAGVRQAVREHGVRGEIRLQHLVDRRVAPDLRHQHAALHGRVPVSRRKP